MAELRSHRTRQLEERLAWGEAWTDSGYVFTRENGEPIHPHSLSQFFETRVGRNEPASTLAPRDSAHATPLSVWRPVFPARVMQERLGHSSLAITLDLYTHPADDQHADADAQVGALLFG